MRNTILVALAAWIAGAVLGCLICRATIKSLRKRLKKLKSPENSEKMGVMDKILVLEAAILFCYTVADMIVFWHTGAEPTTLTACVFGVCGMENGVMGWIKTNKDKLASSAEQAQPERPDPPDAGI